MPGQAPNRRFLRPTGPGALEQALEALSAPVRWTFRKLKEWWQQEPERPRPVPPCIPGLTICTPGDDDESVVSYHWVVGNPGCASGLKLSLSAFRVDADGVSTFERPHQGTTAPCLLPFRFVVPERSPGITAPVDGLSACTSTYTPPPEGHWSIMCVGNTKALLSTYAKGVRDAGEIEVNELYAPD